MIIMQLLPGVAIFGKKTCNLGYNYSLGMFSFHQWFMVITVIVTVNTTDINYKLSVFSPWTHTWLNIKLPIHMIDVKVLNLGGKIVVIGFSSLECLKAFKASFHCESSVKLLPIFACIVIILYCSASI